MSDRMRKRRVPVPAEDDDICLARNGSETNRSGGDGIISDRECLTEVMDVSGR